MEVSEEMETTNTKITGMMAMAASKVNSRLNPALVPGRTRFIFMDSTCNSAFCALAMRILLSVR